MRQRLFLIIIFSITIACTQKPRGVVEWIKSNDPQTGNEVWQITAHDSASVAVYFERQPFSGDDKYVLFGSKRSGDWKIYRADLKSGEIIPISQNTSNRPINFTVHPDGKHVWFVNEQKLYKTNITNLKESVTFDFNDLFKERVRFSSSFTVDAKYTLITTRSDTSRSIYRVNLTNGDVEHVLTKTEGWFSHPLICPTNPDLITYVPGPDSQNDMTLPMEKRARTWIVNMKTGENKQFLTMPYGFRATHETWSSDGKRFFFYKKTRPGWLPVSICSIDQDGSNFREYYSHSEIRLGHGISSMDGKWFVSDGQDPDNNPIILINLETGEAKFLCWPNSSIKEGQNNFGHVHPSFSMSGRYVCYTSDVTGTAQVYVVPTGVK